LKAERKTFVSQHIDEQKKHKFPAPNKYDPPKEDSPLMGRSDKEERKLEFIALAQKGAKEPAPWTHETLKPLALTRPRPFLPYKWAENMNSGDKERLRVKFKKTDMGPGKYNSDKSISYIKPKMVNPPVNKEIKKTFTEKEQKNRSWVPGPGHHYKDAKAGAGHDV
jgi:hypothetical protein